MVSTLELRTRDIKNVPSIPHFGTPQHGYFILTNSHNDQYILRAGPSGDDMLKGYLVADYAKYDSNIQGLATNDYITDPSKYRSVTLFKGDDYQAQQLMDKMWEFGRSVNNHAFDYKLPVCDVVNFGVYNRCAQQNSNAFTYYAMEYAGIKPKLPTLENGRPAWLPGFKSELRDTLLDHLIEYGGHLAAININVAYEIYNKYLEIGKTFSDKAANTYKAVIATLPYIMKSNEMLAIIDNFNKWEVGAAGQLQTELDQLKSTYELAANAECAQRLATVQFVNKPCVPNGPDAELVNTYVFTWTSIGIPIGNSISKTIHTDTTRIWKCKIGIPTDCKDIGDRYQAELDMYSQQKIEAFNLQKQFMLEASKGLADKIIRDINHVDLIAQQEARFDDIHATLVGELNGLKNNLLDMYHISHEAFA